MMASDESDDGAPDHVWVGVSYHEGIRTHRAVHTTREGAKHDIAVLASVQSPDWEYKREWFDEDHEDEHLASMVAERNQTKLVVDRERVYRGDQV